MKIRRAKKEDFYQLYDLWKKTKVETKSIHIEKKEFVRMIQLNPSSCLVGEKNNVIIGSVLGVFNGKRGWIYHLAVDPAYQKKGYGSLLLQKAEEELKKVGANVVLLWVEYTNLEILPFYLNKEYEIHHTVVALRKKF